jgi:hypothetical protein
MQDIHRETGIPLSTLTKWAQRGHNGISWYTEREELSRGELEDSFTKQKLTVSKAASLSPELILRALEAIAARGTPLSTQEMERVANVYAALHKISRLDSGQSTENVSAQVKVKLSLDEVREIIKLDPLNEEEA